MKQVCENLPTWAHALVWVALFGWEFVMGETKFGSTARMIVVLIWKFVLFLIASISKRFYWGKK